MVKRFEGEVIGVLFRLDKLKTKVPNFFVILQTIIYSFFAYFSKINGLMCAVLMEYFKPPKKLSNNDELK